MQGSPTGVEEEFEEEEDLAESVVGEWEIRRVLEDGRDGMEGLEED